MSKLDSLEDKTLFTQNDISFLLDNKKQVEITYLDNGITSVFRCSVSFIIKHLEEISKNPTHIGYFKNFEKDKS